MTVTYLVACNGHMTRCSTTGSVVNDTPEALDIRPDGANFTVHIPRKSLLKVEVN